ncbi:MAG: MBL fold metallo-hydrolase [Candidatus Helarchaeota archaeon]
MVIDFGNGIDKVKIKILTNNMVDMTLQTDPVFASMVKQPTREVASATAEHGLSMHISTGDMNILYDFGGLAFTILNNLEIFKIDPKSYSRMILSHGHFDHFGAIYKLFPELSSGSEFIVSPDAFYQKFGYISEKDDIINLQDLTENFKKYKKEGKLALLPQLKKNIVEKLCTENQIKLNLTNNPIKLCDGIYTSGQIEIFDKSELTKNLFIKIDKSNFKEDTFRDEIAIYIHIKDKGLVILTGCGHTGIINTIKHGQKISGIDKIYAVIGGFHLNWSNDNQIQKIIDILEEYNPKLICGMHCTGFRFNAKLKERLPDKMSLGAVGTEFYL